MPLPIPCTPLWMSSGARSCRGHVRRLPRLRVHVRLRHGLGDDRAIGTAVAHLPCSRDLRGTTKLQNIRNSLAPVPTHRVGPSSSRCHSHGAASRGLILIKIQARKNDATDRYLSRFWGAPKRVSAALLASPPIALRAPPEFSAALAGLPRSLPPADQSRP